VVDEHMAFSTAKRLSLLLTSLLFTAGRPKINIADYWDYVPYGISVYL